MVLLIKRLTGIKEKRKSDEVMANFTFMGAAKRTFGNSIKGMSKEQQFKFIKSILMKPAEMRSTSEFRTYLMPLLGNITFFKELKLKPLEMN